MLQFKLELLVLSEYAFLRNVEIFDLDCINYWSMQVFIVIQIRRIIIVFII